MATTRKPAAKKPAVKKAAAPEPKDQEDSTTREVPAPEIEPQAPEDWQEVAQEDYQSGAEAAKRGWPTRVCPHTAPGQQRYAWMKGYHEFAHPQSNSTVVAEEGNTDGGTYRGKY